MAEGDHLRAFMEPVARLLLGDPNPQLSNAKILRWGSHGSMAVDVEKGVFFDNEAAQGGGVLAFIEQHEMISHDAARDWLHDHFPESKPNGHAGPQITNAYPYEDVDTTLLFEVCRKFPKTFVQRRPDGNGGWVWSTKGVKRVPYRLPELLAAIAAGRKIWIVEGEKDVDRLYSLGLAATTNPGGAGGWKAELSPYFKGADVVVVGDNDPQSKTAQGALQWHADGRPQRAGQDHAQAVAASVRPFAGRVRVLDLGAAWPDCPPKGDVSDFLDAGHTAADLEALADAILFFDLPAQQPAPAVHRNLFTGDQLEGVPVPPRRWHVRDLIPAHNVTMLGGDGGVGKSTLALQLAIATAAEMTWLGHEVRGGRVLHISAEDDRDEIHRRTDYITLHYGIAYERLAGLMLWSLADEDAVLVSGSPGQPLQATARWEELQGIVSRERPSLIVLDSLADFYGGNENERAQVRQFVRILRGLATPHDTAIILLAHPSLTGLSTGSGLSGNTAWNNSVRSRLSFAAVVDEEGKTSPDLRTLTVKKANYAQAGAEMRLHWAGGAFVNDDAERMSFDKRIDDDERFLMLLDAFAADGRTVSHNLGHAYAPALFAQDPRGRGVTSKAFGAAMNRLFANGVVRIDTRGPPSRRVSFIARTVAT
jgi:RecA-family ATPase